jgi:hypothetical protein
MRIDEAGQQRRNPVSAHTQLRQIADQSATLNRQQISNPAIVDDHCMVRQRDPMRLHGNHPARLNHQIDFTHISRLACVRQSRTGRSLAFLPTLLPHSWCHYSRYDSDLT